MKARSITLVSLVLAVALLVGGLPVAAAQGPDVSDQTASTPATTVLPVAFNWCSSGYCPPIPSISCGGWAFATTAVLESNIKIKDGVYRNLSEQYLISCNSDGWTCGAGWFAHDYHQWKYITGEPGPGAVYEVDFPFQGYNVPCNPPHVHHERISAWAYVKDASSVPTVDGIKNAIYKYGPVAAMVYVGSAFQYYTSGIFSTTQTGTPNHFIVLTGWNDTYQYWNLWNTWGTGWGESGYMRIKYGTSRVGFAANYVVYP